MIEVYVRFIADPFGYRLDLPELPPPATDGPRWMLARVGNLNREVWIDVAQAYAIEPVEATA